MRILYDGYIYSMQVAGGINRYFANIIQKLPSDVTPTLTTCRSIQVNAPTHPRLKTFTYPRGMKPRRVSDPLEKHYFRAIPALHRFDVQHPTYYLQLTDRPFSNSNGSLVITVHDMIHELLADSIDPKGYTTRAKKDAIHAAHRLICVSENTKSDLLKIYPEVEDKTVVIYEASELSQEQAYGEESVPSQPYFLHVGSRSKEYKNFDTLLVAFSKAASVDDDILLCVVGPPFNESEQRQIAELKLTNRIDYYGYASDNHLAKLYRCSTAFVYPSLYEGFGIPPLEAMACGSVVVASNASSIPEVVGDAGILFDPTSVGDLADILLQVLESSTERDRLIQKGHQRAKAFSWEKTAQQTLAVYRSLF